MKTKILASISGLLVSLIAPFAILVPQVSAVTDICTWTGGGSDDNFSTVANWSCSIDGVASPEDGDSLVFGVPDATPVNDLGTTVIANLTFDAGTTITGNELGLENVIVNAPSEIYTNVVVAGAAIITGSETLIIGQNSSQAFNFLSPAASVSNTAQIVRIKSTLTGDGTVNQNSTQTLFLSADNSGFNGDVNVMQGSLFAEHLNALGSAVGNTTVSDNARVLYYFTSSQGATPTVIEPFTLGAPSSFIFENYTLGVNSNLEEMFTFSGPIILTANTTVSPTDKADMKITGALSGAFTIGVGNAVEGSLVLAASPNSSSTINGTYKTSEPVYTYSDSLPATSVSVYYKQTVIVSGVRGTTNVASGGTIKGTGTVGTLTLATGSTLAPGLSPGCLSSGNLTLAGTYQVEIAGTTVCTEYDQTDVTGTVNVTGGTLQVLPFLNSYKPADNASFMIIKNDSTDAVIGTFAGLVDGATFTVDGYTVQINYNAGDGNDVMLLVTEVPAAVTAPDTGVGSILTNPLLAIVATLASVTILGGLRFAEKRQK